MRTRVPVTRRTARPGGDAAETALRQGLALALHDLGTGRDELRAAMAGFAAVGDARGRVLAASALIVFIGIADDDYTGFEEAAALLADGAVADLGPWLSAADALMVEAGVLIAGWFHALDAPGLADRASRIAQALGDPGIPAAVRCSAGLTALGYHHNSMDLSSVLWLELAMRPLLADPAIGRRLADEALHMFVQSLYQCEAGAEARALRERRRDAPPGPAVELKLRLLDAQIALGVGNAEAGRLALQAVEPLLDPRAPRPAGWWHLLSSRLHLLEERHRQALTHARLALRLGTESRLPERWMGVTVMQEGQVQMASGEHLAAVPFFERAGRATSGAQARFCWCLAHLARALHHSGRADTPAARTELSAGLALARELAWLNFFRASPRVAAAVCAAALEHGIETDFVREVIAERSLSAVRPDLSAWPWPIRVRTLGGLGIELNGKALSFRGKVAKKPLELLLFVVASGGSDVSASTLAFALWRDLEGDRAHSAFNVALHRLRKLLAHDDAVLLEHGRLSVNPKLMWVDCLAFEQLADQVGLPSGEGLPAPARAAAERAIALYAGAFLHDSENDAWQVVYRSRLASKFKRMVTLLARAAIARGDHRDACALLERGLESDPLAEDLARDLMRQLIDSGEQAAALAVFERCRAAIEQVLGAKPAPATLALVAGLRG